MTKFTFAWAALATVAFIFGDIRSSSAAECKADRTLTIRGTVGKVTSDAKGQDGFLPRQSEPCTVTGVVFEKDADRTQVKNCKSGSKFVATGYVQDFEGITVFLEIGPRDSLQCN